jgi:hypothetical protein
MLSFKNFLTEAEKKLDIKQQILAQLRTRTSDDDIFNKIENILVKYSGDKDWVDSVQGSFKVRGAQFDKDIDKYVINFFVDVLDQIGFRQSNYKGIAEFCDSFAQGKEFINIDKLLTPTKGAALTQIPDLWLKDKNTSPAVDSFLTELYKIAYSAKLGSKTDAGPGEVFLAVISKNIYFPSSVAATPEEIGGDIVIRGRKIEIKGEGGRIYDPSVFPTIDKKTNQAFITAVKATENVTVADFATAAPSLRKNPAVVKYINELFQNADASLVKTLINSIGTEEFKLNWLSALGLTYAKKKKFDGYLYVKKNGTIGYYAATPEGMTNMKEVMYYNYVCKPKGQPRDMFASFKADRAKKSK